MIRQFLILFTYLIFTVDNVLMAQNYSGLSGGSLPKNGIIKGVVQDSIHGQAMEYTNVVLYNQLDSAIVNGVMTSSDGSFVFDELAPGKYYLTMYFIGFNKKTVSEIIIRPDNAVKDIGIVRLELSPTQLSEVTIKGDKAPVEYKIDKKVVNINQNLSSAGGSVALALENVPSVNVDIDGNVTLRGSENYTVLINGKPSVMQGSEALKQIPASSVENVEIITNPSAKYDPEGTSGIINIVMKQSDKLGVSGTMNLTVGTNDKYKGDFLLNFKIKKFNFYTGANYNNMKFRGTGISEKTFFDSLDVYSNSDGIRDFVNDEFGFKGGIDYYISKKTTISISGTYNTSTDERNSELKNTDWIENDYDNRQFSRNFNYTTDNEDNYSISLDYITRFNNKGHELSGLLYYSLENSEEIEDNIFYNANETWQQTDLYQYEALATETGPSDNIRAKLDYSVPVTETSKIEAGYQGRFESQTEDYNYTEFDTISGDWIENTLYSNSMDYKQNIQSIYGIYSGKFKNFEYQAGLRIEYMNRSIEDQMADNPYTTDLLDFFPSVHLTYHLPRENQVQVSYSRRTNRPTGWRLEPFVSYMNSSTMRKGNPDLQPEYINSFDISYLKTYKRINWSLDGYYRITDNKITQLQTLYHVGDTLEGGFIIQPPQVSIDSSIVLNEFDNMDKDYSLGFELMINYDITKWLKISATSNVYHYILKGYVDTSYTTNSSTNWNIKLNTTIRITPSTKLQLSGFYNGPSANLQGTTKGSYYSNISFRQDFFKRRLLATVEFRDIFGTAKYEFNTDGPDFSEHRIMKREPQVLMITLSYVINNYKPEKKGRNGGEDEIDNGGGEF